MKHPFTDEDIKKAIEHINLELGEFLEEDGGIKQVVTLAIDALWRSAVARGVVRHFEQGGDIHACAIIKLPEDKT